MEGGDEVAHADALALLEDQRLHPVVLEVAHERVHVAVREAAHQAVWELPAQELCNNMTPSKPGLA